MATESKVETGASFLTTPVTEAHFLTAEKLNDEQREIQQSAATFVAARGDAEVRRDRCAGARADAVAGQAGGRAGPA